MSASATTPTTTPAATPTSTGPTSAGPTSTGTRLRQAWIVARQEVRRSLFGLRMLVILAATGFPLLLVGISAYVQITGVFGSSSEPVAPGALATEYAGFFDYVLVRLVLFFVCLLVFTRPFRAEVQQRSLHYFFLAPLRRDVLALGKFLGTFLVASGVLVATTVATYLIHFTPLLSGSGSGSYAGFLLRGGGLTALLGYCGVVLLGVLGYGALFFVIGLLFQNPILPAVVLFGWEALNPFLPATLKKLSVGYYLRSFQPVPVPDGPLALLASPPSPWLAIPGLLLVAGACIALAVWRVRTMEISYGEE